MCVFGCGGDRDKGKRPIMGAHRRATCADHRHRHRRQSAQRDARPPSAPRSWPAAPGAREIGDRAEAIRAGVRLLGHGDVLLIAGKGHETGQIVGATVLPFSDHEAVRAALAETPIDG